MKKTNQKMHEALSRIQVNRFQEHTELIELIWPTFIEVDGCVIIQKDSESERKLNLDFILSQFGDRTGFEAAESHVHMRDVSKFFEENPIEGLRFAKKVVSMWAAKLKLDFPNYRFLIILTFHGDDSIVRFHKLRNNEPLWVNIEKLENYKNEGILVEIVSSRNIC
ncbi:hypothetical protein [Paenibacillus sp. UNC217MF]|uniref:hypothetical protein n=1 Tax=Paenibacillus sp. UNC217MF TaxID=1449062 RepID=UPI00048D643B|nr:hypothetical protein [Paenibacillus sp. UNC217MF]